MDRVIENFQILGPALAISWIVTIGFIIWRPQRYFNSFLLLGSLMVTLLFLGEVFEDDLLIEYHRSVLAEESEHPDDKNHREHQKEHRDPQYIEQELPAAFVRGDDLQRFLDDRTNGDFDVHLPSVCLL